jgi:hypothetical protein
MNRSTALSDFYGHKSGWNDLMYASIGKIKFLPDLTAGKASRRF